MTYDYHKKSKGVFEDYKAGKIGMDEVYKRLEKIETEAYEAYPDAEPDGDITYCVAHYLHEIEEWNTSQSK